MAGRVSQEVAEALANATSNARVSQEVAEALTIATPKARVSQEVVEALADATPKARVTGLYLEILVPNIEVFMPLVYPQIPQWTYSVKWAPKAWNMPTQTMTTGAKLDLALANTITHTFELTYQILRDTWNVAGTEFRTMGGFFGAMLGNAGRFLFPWKDDNQVQNQFIATTDGVNHTWTLQRTFGLGEYSFTEPVGYVDLTQPFVAYLNGVRQNASLYSVVQTQPGLQQIEFAGTPTTGQTLTVDMSYFYYCRLPDDNLSFEQFMNKLWTLKKIQIESCRANT